MAISTYDLDVLLISTLKATPAIISIFGDDIRKANWMNPEYVYPALRIEVNRMDDSRLTGNCKGKWFDINVSAYIFTEGASPKACEVAMKAVATRFNIATIGDGTVQSQPLTVDYMPLVADNFNHWRGEVVITGVVREV